MKLRRNEYCPIHRSLFHCGREPIRKERKLIRLGLNASKIHITRGDIGNFDRRLRCGSC